MLEFVENECRQALAGGLDGTRVYLGKEAHR